MVLPTDGGNSRVATDETRIKSAYKEITRAHLHLRYPKNDNECVLKKPK